MSPKSGSWVSLVIASVVIPFLYNLLRSQVSQLLRRALSATSSRFRAHDEIRVRSDFRNTLFRGASRFLDTNVREIGALKSAAMEQPSNALVFKLEPGETVRDNFRGLKVEWTLHKEKNNSSGASRNGMRYGSSDMCLLLKMSRNHRHLQSEYLLHIVRNAVQAEEQQQRKNLYSCKHGRWCVHEFKHPATFESLAMEPELRSRILLDLREFLDGREFYETVGKAWKRGYLLYGPPGTGKSSLIAAIANHLKYHVYDLDLSQVNNNEMLRRLLMSTTKKSVIVMEDIDCCFSSARTSSSSDLTLSGVLSFCDGLWSGCDAERVFIFTTNHIQKLDPALLRRGRMDLHICMSYCRANAMKQLINSYLGIQEHELLPEIEKLVDEVDITPADVAEMLLSNRRDPGAALRCLIEFLEQVKLQPSTLEPSPSPPPEVEENEAAALENKRKIRHRKKAEAVENSETKEEGEAIPGFEEEEFWHLPMIFGE